MTDQTDGSKVTAQTKAVAKNFREKVRKLVDVDSDRTLLFDALREYQRDMDVEKLVDRLSDILNHPDRLPLFQEIRMMIPARHHLTYNGLVPPAPSNNMRVVVVKRHNKNPFGFSIRGGKEHHCGIFITSVQPGSVASTADLKIGEQVISIDGFPIGELVHEEVLNWLRHAKSIKLRLQAVGMLPVQTDGGAIRWELVSGGKRRQSVTQQGDTVEAAIDQASLPPRIATLNPGERRVQIEKSGEPLGCGIVGGTHSKKGIFIGVVQPNSLASAAGLKDGDQITSVNGVSFLQVKHAEAIRVLKSSEILVMTVKSEQDSEQQKEWEEQMETLREQRLLEFASARPSIDLGNEGKPFFIASPPETTSPLSEEGNTHNEDDDLGNVDVYKEALQTPEKVEPSPTKEEAEDQFSDVTDVVQTHLQRLYLEQQRERHERLRKRSQQRVKLLEEVRSMRKVSQESKAADSSHDNTKECAKVGEETTVPKDEKAENLTVKHEAVADVSVAIATKVVEEVTTVENAQQDMTTVRHSAVVAQRSSIATVVRETAVVEMAPLTVATVTMSNGGSSTDNQLEQPLSSASTGSQSEVITASVPSAFADDPPDNSVPQLHVRKAKEDAPQRPSSLVTGEGDMPGQSAVVVQPSLVKALSQVSEQRQAEAEAEGSVQSPTSEKLNYVRVEVSPPTGKHTKPFVTMAMGSEKTVYSEVIVQPAKPKDAVDEKRLTANKPKQGKETTQSSKKDNTREKESVPKESSGSSDNKATAKPTPTLEPAPAHSALKKPSESTGKPLVTGGKSKKKQRKKQASFSTNIECVMISRSDSTVSRSKRLSTMSEDSVNPSNMEFSDDVLQGRQAIFHTIPKNGPLGIKLRGGKGSRHGDNIYIAQIDPEGSVEQYGQLVVGDQILNVEGTSFLDITQQEASEALHEAMQWETDCIDLVVASELTTI